MVHVASPLNAIGLAAGIASRLLPNQRIWSMLNLDDGDTLEGDFEAEGVQESISTVYGEATALNRDSPVSQWLHGKADGVTFTTRFRNSHAFDSSAEEKIALLRFWTKRSEEFRRPPLIHFTIGDGHVQSTVRIDALAVAWETPRNDGSARGAVVQITLTEVSPFRLESGPPPESLYYKARSGDYYELLAFQEYADPMLGDVIRKRHPQIQEISEGDTIKLPSLDAIRSVVVEPKSIVFTRSLKRGPSLQKTLKQAAFDRTNRSFDSTVIVTRI